MVVLSAASCKAYDLMLEPVPPFSRFLRACSLGGAVEQEKNSIRFLVLLIAGFYSKGVFIVGLSNLSLLLDYSIFYQIWG